MQRIAEGVEATGFRSGGPLQTVALETVNSSERLNLACQQAYTLLQAAFAEKLHASGFAAEAAADLAGFITAVIEGATMLSRTYHTGQPLRAAGDQLARVIAAAAQQARSDLAHQATCSGP